MTEKEENLLAKLTRLLKDPFAPLRKESELVYTLSPPGGSHMDSLRIVQDADDNRYVHVENYPIYVPFEPECEELFERKKKIWAGA